MRDAELYDRLREVLGLGWVDLPNEAPFRRTGGPGKMLERLLGLDGGNFDSPDSGRWEIKYHSGTALLTLFHLEGEPKGYMRGLIQNYGWADGRGRTSFRHTIHASSERGFYVVNENNRIIIRNRLTNDFDLAYWTHDRLITAGSLAATSTSVTWKSPGSG